MARLTPNMLEVERIPLKLPFIENAYIQLTGARRFEYLMEKIPDIMNKAAKRGMMRFANQVLGIIKRSMATGMPPPGSGVSWAPLKDKTTKMYQKWGYTKYHPWYVTGEMRNTVHIRSTQQATWIGFPPGMKAKNPNPNGQEENRPTLSKLSKMLEWDGDMHVGRPLWNPAYESAGGNVRLTHFIKEELRREVRRHKGKYYG